MCQCFLDYLKNLPDDSNDREDTKGKFTLSIQLSFVLPLYLLNRKVLIQC